jgi:hypothetical protein
MAAAGRGKRCGPTSPSSAPTRRRASLARARIHPGAPPGPGRAGRVEHEYERRGALASCAAWDVQRAQVAGRCEATTGIVPFGRLVEQVLRQAPSPSARRVFWVVDNGSSHQGARCEARLRARWPSITVVHPPVQASWLDQTEISFSIVGRTVLDPNDFASLAELEARLLAFGAHDSAVATPFEWRFTRARSASHPGCPAVTAGSGGLTYTLRNLHRCTKARGRGPPSREPEADSGH